MDMTEGCDEAPEEIPSTRQGRGARLSRVILRRVS
jgi:hypothetical protein